MPLISESSWPFPEGGEYGDISHVDPYLVAMLYAGDGKDAAPMKVEAWLEEKVLHVVT
ncbi:MAG: hypothetical protein MZV63_13865 [Marinilabiliales bacterium]|nr:hypothetical protein [Marinilabiliales bacterium]